MELNREQIIKGLDCCTRGRKSKENIPCFNCPYNECNIVGGTSERQIKGTCQGWLMKDALALINSQEQRIKELEQCWEHEHASAMEIFGQWSEKCERLTEDIEWSAKRIIEADKKVAKLTEENERLRVDNEILKMPRATIFEIADAFDRGRIKGRADTVREMQERLKAEMSFGRYIQADQIDQIAKEMLEGGTK